jgi:hypothetical protein
MEQQLRDREFVDRRGTVWMIGYVAPAEANGSAVMVVREGLARTLSIAKPPEALTDADVRAAVDRLGA